MSEYDRLWDNINIGIQKRRVDCLHREAVSRHDNLVGIIEVKLCVAADKINQAISRMEKK